MEHTVDWIDPDPDPASPISRKSDPVTSKMAALRFSKTGRKSAMEMLFDLVKEIPNQTSSEYGDILMDRGWKARVAQRMPSRRMPDLVAAGRVCVGKTRKCRSSEYRAQTYYVSSDHL